MKNLLLGVCGKVELIVAAFLILGLLDAMPLAAKDIKVVLDGPDVARYFPNAKDETLPEYYRNQSGFPIDPADSAKRFIEASLARDGIDALVDVAATGDKGLTVTITGDDPAATGYGTILPTFMDAAHAGLGRQGVKNCIAKGSACWDPSPGAQPWAFYLPLGLPLVNQKAVMLLNYPPSDALCAADYLSNFTMARWEGVLTRAGITDPVLYETIVDAHPIAAPGSHQSEYIRATTGYFFEPGKPNYDQAMLDLLLVPRGDDADAARPLQVAGTDALTVWGGILGRNVSPGEVGVFVREGQPDVPWVATNHPDVTTYQHCPGDDGKKSSDDLPHLRGSSRASDYVDDALVEDELMDLRAACVLETLVSSPSVTPEQALAACKSVWCTADNGKCKRRAVCIQARLDYDFYSDGNCGCEAAAAAFCDKYEDNACPSSSELTSCTEFNKLCGSRATRYQATYKKCES